MRGAAAALCCAAFCCAVATVAARAGAASASPEGDASGSPARALRPSPSAHVGPTRVRPVAAPFSLANDPKAASRLAAFPSTADFRRARLWLAGRAGYLGFAVIDSNGAFSGWHAGRLFISGSITKAMLLVQYLRTHGSLTAYEQRLLTEMIEVSDNDAADVIYLATGADYGLQQVARLAKMRHFTANRGYWGYAQINAADQARFFFRMDRLIPRYHRPFARRLLSHIVSWQSYGIPAVARPRWRVYFKGGWRSGLHGGRLLHQVARLERSGVTWAVAVLTDGDPGWQYGIETVKGVTRRLLGTQ
jgi:hypothetical protein